MSLSTALHRFKVAAMVSSVIAGTMLLAPHAHAGECPADKVGVNVTPPGPSAPKDVTDTILSALDLAPQFPELSDRQFRLRRLVIQPGGIVPWHEHGNRPAQIYIISGEVTEYRSSCAVPIVHKAGEVAPEFGNLAHWWKNTGKTEAVLISADLFQKETKDDQM